MVWRHRHYGATGTMAHLTVSSADAASATILGPVPPETDAASACPRVSFFHQPTLETKLRSLFDRPPAAAPHCDGTSVSDIVAACMSHGPCARLICGAEVSDVRVGEDGAVSLSVACLAPSSIPTNLRCRCCAAPRQFFEVILSASRRFLVAADGASSGIRKRFDAVYAGTSASSRWLIVDAVAACAEAEALLLERWPNFNFCCGLDTVFVHARTPCAPAHHRWEFLLPSNDCAPSSAALLRAVGVDASHVRIVREVKSALAPARFFV